MTQAEVSADQIPSHDTLNIISVILTTVPILHHIQTTPQAMDQDRVHDQFHEREEIPFLQYPNIEEDTRIPIHQGVMMGAIGMMVLVETPVVNLIAHEVGLAETLTLVFPRIVVTLALMFPFRDTLLDDHNTSTTVGPVGISERVFTHFHEAYTCLVLQNTRNIPTFVAIASFVLARALRMCASCGVTRRVKVKERAKDIRQHCDLRKMNRKTKLIRQLEFSKNWQIF